MVQTEDLQSNVTLCILMTATTVPSLVMTMEQTNSLGILIWGIRSL